MDDETREAVDEGEALSYMVSTPGWNIVRHKIIASMRAIDSIRGIGAEKETDTKVLAELAARQIAVETMAGWFKEIDGLVENFREQLAGAVSDGEDSDDNYIAKYGGEGT